MPAPKIGINGSLVNTRASLDFYLGSKVQALQNALRDAHNAKLLLDQFSNAELVALGYTDGTNGTADEVGYLRSGMVACADLDAIRFGQAPQLVLPHVYQDDLKYVCQQ